MNAIGNIAAILLLACLSLQDFRERSISAWLLPAMLVCLLLPPCSSEEIGFLLYPNFVLNFFLLLLQFTCLWLLISARNRKWTNIINTQIGTGDMLMLVCLTPFFSPLNYFLLFTLAIVLTLIITLLMGAMRRLSSDQIPFAGLLALPLIVLCTARLFYPGKINFSSDEWITTLILTQN
jgi:hypothetical protein